VTNTARQGRDVEHAARKTLTLNGYWTHRSAGSKGEVDIIALKPGQMLFIQCKRRGTMAPQEWNRLWILAMRLGATPILARRATPVTKIEFWRLTAAKNPQRPGGKSPMVPFVIDEVAEVAP
jgi:Holliday junction resolvase